MPIFSPHRGDSNPGFQIFLLSTERLNCGSLEAATTFMLLNGTESQLPNSKPYALFASPSDANNPYAAGLKVDQSSIVSI